MIMNHAQDAQNSLHKDNKEAFDLSKSQKECKIFIPTVDPPSETMVNPPAQVQNLTGSNINNFPYQNSASTSTGQEIRVTTQSTVVRISKKGVGGGSDSIKGGALEQNSHLRRSKSARN